MNNEMNSTTMPARILYTMVRVTDLDRSINFYREAFGMREMRRETFTEGRFTLVFMGYGYEDSQPTIELTFNWDENKYEHGTGYGHVALEVSDIYGACERFEKMGIKIVREAGPMKFAVDETGHREVIAFIEDPNGYRIELIEQK